jgi:hypothetical protein
MVLVIVETAVNAIGMIRTSILEATTTRSLITTNAIADRDALDARDVSIEAAGTGCGNIAETGLRILVNACGEAV